MQEVSEDGLYLGLLCVFVWTDSVQGHPAALGGPRRVEHLENGYSEGYLAW